MVAPAPRPFFAMTPPLPMQFIPPACEQAAMQGWKIESVFFSGMGVSVSQLAIKQTSVPGYIALFSQSALEQPPQPTLEFK